MLQTGFSFLERRQFPGFVLRGCQWFLLKWVSRALSERDKCLSQEQQERFSNTSPVLFESVLKTDFRSDFLAKESTRSSGLVTCCTGTHWLFDAVSLRKWSKRSKTRKTSRKTVSWSIWLILVRYLVQQ